MMKKLIGIALIAVLAVCLAFPNAFAAGESSSKATAMFSGIAMTDTTALAGQDALFTMGIKTAQEKELFIDVSLECGLTTNTKVVSKGLARDIAESYAQVKVWVTVDGEMAQPGVVTFARRAQALIAEFAGDFSDCMTIVTDSEGNPSIVIDEDCVQPEMLALVLDTMSANSFNFIAPNVPVGYHIVKVYAEVDYGVAGDPEESQLLDQKLEYIANPVTNAYIGKGSVTVEEVRMVK